MDYCNDVSSNKKYNADRDINLSIIIPAYNEEQNLVIVVDDVTRALAKNNWIGGYEILLINDGSLDNTGKIADGLAQKYNSVHVIYHAINLGIGAALKTGFSNIRGNYVTLIPADGEVQIDQVLNLFQRIGKADLLVTKRSRSMPFYRELFTRGFNYLIKLILGFDSSNYAGIFIVRREVLESLNLQSNTGLLYFEMLMKCYRMDYKIESGTFYASPRLSGKSKVTNLRSIRKVLGEIIKLRFG